MTGSAFQALDVLVVVFIKQRGESEGGDRSPSDRGPGRGPGRGKNAADLCWDRIFHDYLERSGAFQMLPNKRKCFVVTSKINKNQHNYGKTHSFKQINIFLSPDRSSFPTRKSLEVPVTP